MSAHARSAVLTNYLEVARQYGLNTHALMSKAGLSQSVLNDPEQRIPVEAAIRLMEASARESGCVTLGLRMAELRQLSDFGEVSLLLSHQHSLRDALQVIVQYRHLLNDSLAIHIEEAGKAVIIREEVVSEYPTHSRQAIELAIGVMHRFCAALLGAHWHPISVNFTHEAPAELSVHRRIFGCQLEFGSEFNGIVCPDADLDATNPHADPAMARYAQRYLDSLQSSNGESMLFEVRKAIYLLLPMGRATIEQIAQTLGMNVRTLQRRLAQEGETVSQCLRDVRLETALVLLQSSTLQVSEIAARCGYESHSRFSAAFRERFGFPPSQLRP